MMCLLLHLLALTSLSLSSTVLKSVVAGERVPTLSEETTEEAIINAIPKQKEWRPFKVLVIAASSAPSHFQLNVKFAELLCKRGHQVVSPLFKYNETEREFQLGFVLLYKEIGIKNADFYAIKKRSKFF